MARAEYGAIITSMRGSIGGMTFSATATAQTVRRKPRPPNPRQLLQVAKINQFAALMGVWRTLTATQRADWATWAASVTFTNSQGQTYSISGFQAWTRYRMAFAPADATFSNNGPLAVGFGVNNAPTYAMAGANLQINGHAFAPIANEFNFITVFRGTSITRNSPQGLTFIRFKDTTTTGVPNTIAANITAGFLSGSTIRIYIDSRCLTPSRQLNNYVRQSVDAVVP